MEQQIEVEVLLRDKDMSKFLIHHTYTRLGGVFGLLLSIVSVICLFVFWEQFIPMQRWILGILGLMFTAIQPILLWSKGKKQLKQEIFQKPFHYIFGQKSALVMQGDYKESFEYSSIRKVVATKDAIYVYLSAVSAFILPRECCQEQYVELAKRLKEK